MLMQKIKLQGHLHRVVSISVIRLLLHGTTSWS
jgi:hypothetical protein